MKFKTGKQRHNSTISFDELIPAIVEDLDIKDTLIIDTIRTSWESICGNILAAHSRPDRIFNKTLFIQVEHSVYANEIDYMKSNIVEYINKNISAELIKQIKTEIKRIKWQ